jgi:hypothetical protein
MRELHRYSYEIPELHVNRFHAAENGDDDEDDDEEEEVRRHDEEEEEEEEEPVWTASGVLIDTTRFCGLRSTCSWSGDCRFAAGGADRDKEHRHNGARMEVMTRHYPGSPRISEA